MAYRNRYDEYLRKRQGVLPDAKQWKAADYARISREDGDKEESDSIGTQFDIIDDYIAHNDDITFVDRYSDGSSIIGPSQKAFQCERFLVWS